MAMDVAGSIADERSNTSAGKISLGARPLVVAIWTIVLFVLAGGIAREAAAAMTGIPSGAFDHPVMSLDGEANLPAAVSGLLLAFAALLLFVQSRVPGQRRADRINWLLLSAGFLFLSVDEVAQLHEQLKVFLRPFELTDWFYFSWVAMALPAVLVVAVYFLPFVVRLPAATGIGFAFAGMLYVGGAVGMEMVNGRLVTHTGAGSPFYIIGMVTEESLELLGIALFLTVLLRYMRHVRIAIAVRPAS